MGTATALAEPLREALVEAIAPYCGRPQGRPGRGGAPRRASPARPPLDAAAWKQIGRDVMALHEGYTNRTAEFSQAANPIHERLPAYQFYYLPRNWWRVARVIDALPWASSGADGLPATWLAQRGAVQELELLDLGSGTGAFSLAWLARLAAMPQSSAQPLRLRLTLVDQGRQLLELALANIQAFARRVLPGSEVHCDLHAEGVQAFLAGRAQRETYAIAGGAMMLNELSLLGPRRVSERAVALVDALRNRMRPGGCLMFVEPGTRRGYMNLMVLRDQLAPWPLLHPCPHNAHCPMWGGQVRNWCHATERLPTGFFFDAVLRKQAGLRFDMRDVQVAALAAQVHAPAELAPPFQSRRGERIVSSPMRPRTPRGAPPPPRNAQIVLVCAPDGRLHERPAPRGVAHPRGVWTLPSFHPDEP